MKRFGQIFLFGILVGVVSFSATLTAGLRNKETQSEAPSARSYPEPTPEDSTESDLSDEAEELMRNKEAAKAAPSAPAGARIKRRAEAFIAGAEWEFDGFIAGGQDQNVKSMFATNDLVYLNIGSEQGLKPGERLGV